MANSASDQANTGAIGGLAIGLAAAQWQVDRQHLLAAEGKITDSQSSRSVDYATLLKGQQLTQTVTDETPLIPATNWKVAGQGAGKVDGRDFVTGRHRYPSDQKLPDMLYGKVSRPTAFNATLVSVDTSKAEQMGATVVHDGDFVGVAAPSTELAAAAVAAIHAEWKSDPQPSNKDLFDYLRKNTVEGKDPTGDGDRYEVGSVDQAMGSADHRLQQTYTVSYIAHTPLEPRAALAKWDDDHLTVWTGTQRPFGVRVRHVAGLERDPGCVGAGEVIVGAGQPDCGQAAFGAALAKEGDPVAILGSWICRTQRVVDPTLATRRRVTQHRSPPSRSSVRGASDRGVWSVLCWLQPALLGADPSADPHVGSAR